LIELFSKSSRGGGRGALLAHRNGRNSLGVFFLPSLFLLRQWCQKKKRNDGLTLIKRLRAAKKGKNPTCGFSLFSPAEKIHPFRALSDDKGVSPSAEGDQRPTALDPCRFLKKAGKNFPTRFVRT
jgi:hypothetical protein